MFIISTLLSILCTINSNSLATVGTIHTQPNAGKDHLDKCQQITQG